MDEEPHTERDDISALDEQDQSKWTETIKNVKSSRLDQDHSIITSDLSSDVGGRVRLYSESQVHSVSRWEDEWQDGILVEEGGDGAPFRGRSQSAPAALWKAKKYGRQLRRMSDEFDTWLDKGEFRRARSARNVPQKQTSRGWFSFLWGSEEEEGRE